MIKKIAFKVDVDTYDGMQKGVPQFLKLFKDLDIKTSFYIPFGPDQSGRAIFRIFKKKGFLKKMLRSNPVKLYGFKTMLRGTLLPGPMIGSSFPEIARQVLSEGHELGIHGYNHVYWQDHLLELSESEIAAELERAMESYKKTLGFYPRAFAAPAWLCEDKSLRVLDNLNLDYVANSRGRFPCFPKFGTEQFKTLEFPSTLPTLDELLGRQGLNAKSAHDHLTRILEQTSLPLHVHTIHTEVEGLAAFNEFEVWTRNLKNNGWEFVRLCDQAEILKNQHVTGAKSIPNSELFLGNLPGRAGVVACQK